MTQADGAVADPSTQSTPSPEASQGGDSAGRAWFDSAFGRAPIELPAAGVSESSEEPNGKAATTEGEAAPAGVNLGEPKVVPDGGASSETPDQQVQREAQEQGVTFTREEFERAVQAENDRREYRRQQVAERQRLAELRKTDPFQYAEEMEKIEEQATDATTTHEANRQIYGAAITHYDRNILDPITLTLSDSARSRLLKGELNTLEDRQAFVKGALHEIEQEGYRRGVSETRQKMRNDPTFRKEQLAELRADGGVAEPEALEPAGQNGRPTDMNSLLRRGFGRRS